jgi:hypothetical protein
MTETDYPELVLLQRQVWPPLRDRVRPNDPACASTASNGTRTKLRPRFVGITFSLADCVEHEPLDAAAGALRIRDASRETYFKGMRIRSSIGTLGDGYKALIQPEHVAADHDLSRHETELAEVARTQFRHAVCRRNVVIDADQHVVAI